MVSSSILRGRFNVARPVSALGFHEFYLLGVSYKETSNVIERLSFQWRALVFAAIGGAGAAVDAATADITLGQAK